MTIANFCQVDFVAHWIGIEPPDRKTKQTHSSSLLWEWQVVSAAKKAPYTLSDIHSCPGMECQCRSDALGWCAKSANGGPKRMLTNYNRSRECQMLTAAELCALVPPATRVFFFGDSLSRQFVGSWAARLRAHIRCVNTGSHGKQPIPFFHRGSMWCPGTEAAHSTSAISFFEENRLVDESWPTPGARLGVIALEPTDFQTELGLATPCAEKFRRKPSEFNVHAITVEGFKGLMRRLGATHVIFNTFAHLNHVIRKLSMCYADEIRRFPNAMAGDESSDCTTKDAGRRCSDSHNSTTADLAWLAATRDVMRYWRRQVILRAAALADIDSIRFIYRPSPAPGTLLCGEQCAKGSLDRSRCTKPLSKEEYTGLVRPREVDGSFYGHQPECYSHGLVHDVNKISSAAFRSFGLDAIDDDGLETMMGTRIEAHSADDLVHFCLRGVPDYALDAILRTIFGDAVEQRARLLQLPPNADRCLQHGFGPG